MKNVTDCTITIVTLYMRPTIDSWRACVNADVILLSRRQDPLIASLLDKQRILRLLHVLFYLRKPICCNIIDLHRSIRISTKNNSDLNIVQYNKDFTMILQDNVPQSFVYNKVETGMQIFR